MGISFSLQEVSWGDRSPSVSHTLAQWTRSFIEPVTERFSDLENSIDRVEGATN